MAGSLLGNRRAATKQQITQASAHRHSAHDPAIVSHEDEPFLVRHRSKTTCTPGKNRNLHDHKGVEVLNGIQHRLDDVHPPRYLFPVLACGQRKKRGCLSSCFFILR